MSEIGLPGFRFHPTDEELLEFYLRGVVYEKKKLNFDVIGTLNIYRHDPWELPNLAKIGEREWYFYVPRDRKQANGGRPNRTTERGFWKATGSDRSIRSAADPKRLIGLRKTLVFYTGRAPRGGRTDWVMNEYRLPDSSPAAQHTKDMVLCKVYRKATSLKELEQRAAMEEETRATSLCSLSATTDAFSSSDQEILPFSVPFYDEDVKEVKQVVAKEPEASPTTMLRSVNLPELQVPLYGLEWMQDSFLTQLRSPWMEQWSPYYANILNS